jgi:transposase
MPQSSQMSMPPPATAGDVGIDVAKAWLDVAVRPSGETGRTANLEADLPAVVERLQALGPQLVVLEATGRQGGYERVVVALLASAGMPIAVVHPPQGRAFATATGRLATTDRLDAGVLAHVAAAVRPQPRPLPDAQAQALGAVVKRRQQLVTMLAAKKHRRQQAAPVARPLGAAPSAWLERALAERDQQLDRLVRASPLWRERDDRLRSGPASARWSR